VGGTLTGYARVRIGVALRLKAAVAGFPIRARSLAV
jgi:hypothetical protein